MMLVGDLDTRLELYIQTVLSSNVRLARYGRKVATQRETELCGLSISVVSRILLSLAILWPTTAVSLRLKVNLMGVPG